MYALKEKVTEKLSYLFADSPHQSSSPRVSPSSIHQARPNSKEERSFSSIFSSVISSFGPDGAKVDKDYPDINSYQSLPVSRESYDLDEDGGYDVKESHKNIEDGQTITHVAGGSKQTYQQSLDNRDDEFRSSMRSNSDSDAFEGATEQLSPGKPMPDLTEDSVFISQELYEFWQSSLPNIVKGCKWVLVYSTLKDGISLRTLIRKSAELPGPCVLIAGDKKGAVFGAMLECPLKPTPKRKYQGTNQTCVFTTKYGEPRLFRPTGANRYYYMCLNDLLALGGGGDYALCLDGDLLSGTSGPCDTFGNECLAYSQEFELKNLELWGFAHSSRFLS